MGIWSKLLDWALGGPDADYAHDPAWIAAHTGNESYFQYHGDDDADPDDSFEPDDAGADDFTPDGA
jgi:hypothetical protein